MQVTKIKEAILLTSMLQNLDANIVRNIFQKKTLKPNCQKKDQDPVKCDKCNKIFADETNLKKHEHVHSEEPDSIYSKYNATKCPHCNKKFERKYLLRKHVQSEHATIWEKYGNKLKQKADTRNNFCTDCDVQFVTFEAKTNHMRDHICDHCQTRFESPRQVAKHLMDLWKNDQKENISLKAKIFKMESQPLKASIDEISEEPKNDNDETMNEDQSFPENETLPENVTFPENELSPADNAQGNIEGDQNNIGGNITSTCKVCRKIFSSEEDVVGHYISEHVNTKCEMCDLEFTDNNILETHKKKCPMNDDKLKGSQIKTKLACDQCGKTFMNEQKLKNHNQKVHVRRSTRTRRNYKIRSIISNI